MSKEIVAVYQDCVLCGDKGRKKIADFAMKGINIRKVGFATPEGRDLCYKALSLGVESMPFFTDGDIYATSIEAVIAGNLDKKPAKKNKKEKRGKKNGTISKS